MRSRVLAALLLFAALVPIRAQPPAPPPGRAIGFEIHPALHHDMSPPLRAIAAVPLASGTARQFKEPGPIRRGRGPRGRRVDTIVQDYPSTPVMPLPSLNFEGINNVNGVLPPDTNGDVGPNHYVQWVNLSFAIWSKGSASTPPTLIYGPAAGSTLWRGFGGPCEADNNGDPIVMYDHLADRWFMSQLALPNVFFGYLFSPFYQCIAVSATPDPTGPYYRYQYSFNKLNDYGKFGVWPDGYYMAINQFQAISLQWAGQGVVAFDRARMLSGQSASMVYLDLAATDMNLGGMLPAHLAGPAPPAGSPAYYVQMDDDAWGYAPTDQLQLWRFHVDWANPSASTFTRAAQLPTEPFDSDLCGHAENCIPQPGTSAKVDALSDRLMYRLQYHNFGDHESLVVNHTVDVDGLDHAGIRWYEIRSPGGAPAIFQQGTYAPDANHRWMGSLAMDRFGNMALGYSVSGTSTAPSIRYTGRLAADPPGVMTQGEADLAVGAGSQLHSSGRWGDYSLLAVDPVDQCTFWYTQEYYAATSDAGWQTRVGTFAFPDCVDTSPDMPRVTVTATANRATEAGLVKGTFTFARTGDLTQPLDVHFEVSSTATAGSDYVPLPNMVTIGAGASTATVDVVPLDDLAVEPDEIVVVTIGWDPGYIVGTPSSATVTIVSDDLPPDLVVSALTPPAVGGAGSMISVTDTTKNQGNGPSDTSATGFYLSTNTVFDAADIPLGTRAVPTLAVGGVSTATTMLTIPASTATGSYYIIAKADSAAAIVETVESNNTRSAGPIRVGPDLTISSFTVPVSVIGDGDTVTVSDATSNVGGADAGPSRTAVYLSTNAGFDSSDQMIGWRDLGPVVAGTGSSGSMQATVPLGTTAGIYYLIAKADANNTVIESQETNNTRVSASIKVGADLVVSSLTAQTTAGGGGTATVTDTTKNQGAGSPTAPSATAFYLSTNTAFDAGDILLGSRPVKSLGAGQTETVSTTLQIPTNTATGSYFILAKADANNQVVESVESNNVNFTPIKIGPDLTETALSWSGTAIAGGSINITETTKNAGGGGAGPSTTKFYLSTNGLFDASDVFVCSRDVGALSGGGISTATTPCTIPASTAPGAMFLIGVVDGGNAVQETSETNNTLAVSIRIN